MSTSIYGEIIRDVASYVASVGAAMESERASYRELYAYYLTDLDAPLDGKNQTANAVISMEKYSLNQADNVVVAGTSGNNSFSNLSKGTNAVIFGEAGNDSIHNTADNVAIFGGAGNDTIEHYSGDSALLMGGAGNDSILIEGGSNVSIRGGTGNDNLHYYPFNGFDTRNRREAIIYQYAPGDGNDTISGWSPGSTLQVEGSYTTSTVSSSDSSSLEDLVVHVGSGSITISHYGNEYLRDLVTIETVPSGRFSSYVEPTAPTVSSGSSSTSTSGSSSTSTTSGGSSTSTTGGGSSTSTTSGGSSTSTTGGGSSTSTTGGGSSTSTTSGGSSTSTQNIYTGGNQVITNYSGQPVTLGAFTGANFSGSNFLVHSSTGTLTIQNVTDKVVDLRNGAGGEFIKAYTPSSAGVIDGTGISAYGIIYGSSAGTDVIFAGSGGGQFWGGAGDIADAIVGGDGSDIFIGGRYQGSDNFLNVSSSDVVNLTDATLSDIVAAVESGGNVLIGFNTGNIISIQSTGTLSAAINLADGTSWRYNHATKAWQGA